MKKDYRPQVPQAPRAHGIALKKQFGQHFLRDQHVIDNMLDHVQITNQTSIFEIGCGDGFLTKFLLQTPVKQLWIFEIDHDWATYVQKEYADPRMTIFEENILDVDFARFEQDQPWTLCANLPYQITMPLLNLLQKNRLFLREGVIMIQEEVAQKLTQTSGRGYGFISLYFQHYFELKLLNKIHPDAFFPPPKVFSRLVYFKPNQNPEYIEREEQFWKWIKLCFHQPRRTLRNNLSHTHYDLSRIPEAILQLRAQQMSKADLVNVWKLLI
ncbi:MAG: 16S rRNA (adenine(1518)-N(6)/adenine(1519)-N(6))-dimethyltransferase RsmA [Candidatus Babeliaceae bacterium]|jgi:16S rRNA (adenine1518-N6/adenine1519-N6)-dimethyltransferase